MHEKNFEKDSGGPLKGQGWGTAVEGAHRQLAGKAPSAVLQNVTAAKVDAEVLDLALASLGI